MMLSIEQRAHDLAVALISNLEFSGIEKLPSEKNIIDFSGEYSFFYEYFLHGLYANFTE